jgi:Na+/H+ antiporter NhaD/arsenite permease-like protein
MSIRLALLGLAALLTLPATAAAADHAPVALPVWSVAPFVLLLLAIALLPLLAGPWWHHTRNQLLVAALFAIPVAIYLVYRRLACGEDTLRPLLHEVATYLSFIFLLGALYVVSGGVVLEGDLRPTPLTNTAFLAGGAALANFVGTTGASVLLIRPVLRLNQPRQHTAHLPVFFIFTVSNLGGLLTPLGDPPLFLGFLNGVPFAWTLTLWREWLAVNGLVLAVFFVWDTLAYRREDSAARVLTAGTRKPVRLRGHLNLLFLAGIMGVVLLQGVLPSPWGDLGGGLLMVFLAGLSFLLTPGDLRAANGFTWHPILEVAILFAGIFVTMVPALELLGANGREFGLTRPWHFFWLTGGLSSFLDNAPTYLTFATLAAGSSDFSVLVRNEVPGIDGPRVLRAISCGAVLMGALTYIGNGPNFMVKAIADAAGYRTPSFFGFLAYSYAILLPVFVLLTLVFFWS